MKKLLCVIIMMFALVCLLASCGEHTHDYGEWENVTNPTCTVDGSKVRYCTCGEEQIKPIYATGHIETTYSAVDATCTNTGLTEGKFCSVCKEVTLAQTVVPALGHTEVIDEAVDATCTETGLTEGKHCSVCNEVTLAQTVVPALGHTEVVDEAVDATCTETGLTEGKHCSTCNEILVAQTETAKISHTYDDKYDESCNKCGFIRDAECTHLNVTTLPSKDATCTESGLTEGKICAKCEEILVVQTAVDALGHTEIVDEAVDATCTENGLTEGKHCNVCHTTLIWQVSIEAKGHNFVNRVCITCGEKYYSQGLRFTPNGDGTCYVSGVGDCTDSDIVIPAVDPNGFVVTGIGALAFQYCSSITSITLPASIVNLANDAFSQCDIDKVYVISIDHWLSISYTSNPLIGQVYDLYVNDERVVDLVIPDGVITIKDSAFYGCSSIETVVIPEGVRSIGSSAFAGCMNVKCVMLPKSLTEIMGCAFLWGDSIDFYYNGAPSDWEKMTVSEDFYSLSNCRVVYYSETEPSVEGNFWHLVDDVPTLWPAYVKPDYSIGLEYTSNGDGTCYVSSMGTCTDVKIIIPEVSPDEMTVVGIGQDVFSGNSLTSITIPQSINYIGLNAFRDCTNIKSVHITDVKAWCEIVFGGYYSNPMFYGGDLLLNGNLVTDLVIPEGTSIIEQCAFFNYSKLTSVIIPDSVTSIGTSAFYGCTNLAKVKICGEIFSIGSNAFCGCSFVNIYLPEGLSKIDANTFSGCSQLTSIVIPNSLTLVGKSAFVACTKIKSVYYNGSAEEWSNVIIDGGFGDNQYFIDANPYYYSETKPTTKGNFWHWVDGVPTVWSEYVEPVYSEGLVFRSNGNGTCDLDSVGTCADEHIVIPPTSPNGDIVVSIGAIGSFVFANSDYKDNIKSITIPDTVSFIWDGVFSNCKNLVEIKVSEDNPYFTTIDGSLYDKNVTRLYRHIPTGEGTSIVIPKTVTRINSYAFSVSKSLTTIFYGGNASEWSKVNGHVSNKTVYFYSEIEPTTEGNFWHYVDGVTTVWT